MAAPDAALPPVRVVEFQVAAGPKKGDWVGFGGTTVCCGACAKLADERGIWGLVPAGNVSQPADGASAAVYYVQNLWRAPSEPRVG